MARATLHTAVAAASFLLLLGLAAAQPCIRCTDCKTNNCWRVCKPSCPGIKPSQVIVSGDACKRQGEWAAAGVARSACETARKYCNGGRSMTSSRYVGPTNLAQCANIAMGSCQQRANNPSGGHPCGRQIRSGFKSCSASQFKSFFQGETRDLCMDKAKSITGVQPGTNNWAVH
ncbi:MAG: hypothetical protein J3K34DRAFT_422576 [Monoraphidium minutum]|nr:MAG: hypothetical protein J3K34DRAFT_422576 [Monoraphidium minutum]